MPTTVLAQTNGLTRVVTGMTAGNETIFKVYPRKTVVVEMVPEVGSSSATIVATSDENAPADITTLAEDPSGPFAVATIKNLGDKLNFVAVKIASGTWTVRVTN